MKFRLTEFLNTPYRVSCYIKLYRKLFSCMIPAAREKAPRVHLTMGLTGLTVFDDLWLKNVFCHILVLPA